MSIGECRLTIDEWGKGTEARRDEERGAIAAEWGGTKPNEAIFFAAEPHS